MSQKSQETCARVFFLIKFQTEAYNFVKKEALAHVFSCEFYESFKNTLFSIIEHIRWLLLSSLIELILYSTISHLGAIC